jgi:dCTP deaminase
LTLDTTIRTFNAVVKGVETILDPSSSDYVLRSFLENGSKQVVIDPNGYVLEPNKLILAWTAETVALHGHGRVAARVEGKSSLARLGLAVHVTAPTIHGGFSGNIQLEVINYGPLAIRLRPGMKICQLIFEQTLGVAEKLYQGQFKGQAPV